MQLLEGCEVISPCPRKKLIILLKIRNAVYRLPFIHPFLFEGTNAAKGKHDFARTLFNKLPVVLAPEKPVFVTSDT